MKLTLTLAIAAILMGCATPSTAPSACPPLPQLGVKASRAEARLWTLTLVSLYKQCADAKGSK